MDTASESASALEAPSEPTTPTNTLEALRVLWAVDPFAESAELQESAVAAIRELARERGKVGVQIQPAYVYSTYAVDSTTPDLLESAEEAIARMIGDDPALAKALLPIKALSKPSLSIREGVEEIVGLAKAWGASLIVAATHARKGPKRWFLGSFTETLLLHSDVPVLAVNPRWKGNLSFRSIFFPTDFSKESRAVFHEAIDLAARNGGSITLYHKPRFAMSPALESSIGASMLYEDTYEAELLRVERLARHWVEAAKNRGVEAEFVLERDEHNERNPGSSIAESILKAAQGRDGIIALAGQSGAAAAAMIGSVAREIVRNSIQPVWLIHPRPTAPDSDRAKATDPEDVAIV